MTTTFLRCASYKILDPSVSVQDYNGVFPRQPPVPVKPGDKISTVFTDRDPEHVYKIAKGEIPRVVIKNIGIVVVPPTIPEGPFRLLGNTLSYHKTVQIPAYDELEDASYIPSWLLETSALDPPYKPTTVMTDDQFKTLMKEHQAFWIPANKPLSKTKYVLEAELDFTIYPVFLAYYVHESKQTEVQFEYGGSEATGNVFRDVLAKAFRDLETYATSKITFQNILKGESNVSMLKKRSALETMLTRNGEMGKLKAYEMMTSGNLEACGPPQLNQEDYFKQFKGKFDSKVETLADTSEHKKNISSMKEEYMPKDRDLREVYLSKPENEYTNLFKGRRRFKMVDGMPVPFTPEDYAKHDEQTRTIDESIAETRADILKSMKEQDNLIDGLGREVPERYKVLDQLHQNLKKGKETKPNLYSHVLNSANPKESAARLNKIIEEFSKTEEMDVQPKDTTKEDAVKQDKMLEDGFRNVDEMLKDKGTKIPLEDGEYLHQNGDFCFLSPYCDYYFDVVLDGVAFPLKLVTQKLTSDMMNIRPIICKGDNISEGQLTYNDCIRFGFPVEVTLEEETKLFGDGCIKWRGLELELGDGGKYRAHITRPDSVFHIRYPLQVRSARVMSDSYAIRYEDEDYEEVVTIPSCRYGTPAKFFALPTLTSTLLDKYAIEDMNAMVMTDSVNFSGNFGGIPVLLMEPYVQTKAVVADKDEDPELRKLKKLTTKSVREIIGLPQDKELFKLHKIKFKILDQYTSWYRCLREWAPCEFKLPVINQKLEWSGEVGYFGDDGIFYPHANSDILIGALDVSLEDVLPTNRELLDIKDYRLRFNPTSVAIPAPYAVAKISLHADFVDHSLYLYLTPAGFTFPSQELMMISRSQNLPALNIPGSILTGTAGCTRVTDRETNEVTLQLSNQHFTLLSSLYDFAGRKYTFPQEFHVEYLGQNTINEQICERGDKILADVYYPIVNNIYAPKFPKKEFTITQDMRVLKRTGIVDYLCYQRIEIQDFQIKFSDANALWENTYDEAVQLIRFEGHNLTGKIEDNTLYLSLGKAYSNRDVSYGTLFYSVHKTIRKSCRVDVEVINKGNNSGTRTIRVISKTSTTDVNEHQRGNPTVRQIYTRVEPSSKTGNANVVKRSNNGKNRDTGITKLDEDSFTDGLTIAADTNITAVGDTYDMDEGNLMLGDYTDQDARDKIYYAFSGSSLVITLNDNLKLDSKYEKILNDPENNGAADYYKEEDALTTSEGMYVLQTNCPTDYYIIKGTIVVVLPGHGFDELYFNFSKTYSEIRVKYLPIKSHYWLSSGETVLHDTDVIVDSDKISINNPYKWLTFSDGLNYAYLDPDVVREKGIYTFKVRFEINGTIKDTIFEFAVQDYTELYVPSDRTSLEVTANYLFDLSALKEDPIFCTESFDLTSDLTVLESGQNSQYNYVCRVLGTVECGQYIAVTDLSDYTVDLSYGKYINKNLQLTKVTKSGNYGIVTEMEFKYYASNFFMITKDLKCLLYLGVAFTDHLIMTNDSSQYLILADRVLSGLDAQEFLVPKHIDSNTFPYMYNTVDLEATRSLYRYALYSTDDEVAIENVDYHLVIEGEIVYHNADTGILLNNVVYDEIFIEAKSALVRGNHLINAKPLVTSGSSFYYYNTTMFDYTGRPRTTIDFTSLDQDSMQIVMTYRIADSWYTETHKCNSFELTAVIPDVAEVLTFTYNDVNYTLGSKYPVPIGVQVLYQGEHQTYLIFNKSTLGEEGITKILTPDMATTDVIYTSNYTGWKFRNENLFFDIQKLVYIDDQGNVREDDFVFFNGVTKMSLVDGDDFTVSKYTDAFIPLPFTPIKIFAYATGDDIPYRDVLTSEETVDQTRFGDYFSYDASNSKVTFDNTTTEAYEFDLVVVFSDKQIAVTTVSKDLYDDAF